MIMCRSCRRPGSTLASARERKSACFWLLPSSTTRSPGAEQQFQGFDDTLGGQHHAVGEVADPVKAALLFGAPPRPLRRWILGCCHGDSHGFAVVGSP
ncbi:hypothetical protein PPS11_21949 [Pseudomonas putida S11]|nr:hypothetical protein PPS11_21949 [Pseudomonas putida S11]